MKETIRFLKRISRPDQESEEAQQKLSSPLGNVGFLLFDSTLSPTFANDEAIKVLTYPGLQEGEPRLEEFLKTKIRSLNPDGLGTAEEHSVKWFVSGRRHYTCRLVPISPYGRGQQQPMMALIIERNAAFTDLFKMVKKFKLTQRESEAVRHLALGLTNKEIALRMGVSTNTVNAFLRLVMIKTGVTKRSGIIGKFLKNAQ